MTTEIGVRRPGSRTSMTGMLIAALGVILLIIGVVSSGRVATASVLIVIAGLVIAGIGFARRVLAALERR